MKIRKPYNALGPFFTLIRVDLGAYMFEYFRDNVAAYQGKLIASERFR